MSQPIKKKLPVINDCRNCGVCCLHMGYPAFMEPVESSHDAQYWRALPDHLKQELLDYIAACEAPPAGQLDGPCIWLDPDTRLCKHHEYRPRVCRDFEIGSKECRDWRKHYGID